MLKPIKSKSLKGGGGRFVIVASQYNRRYVDAMVRAAKAELRRAKVREVSVIRVPGAFEIPLVSARLARTNPFHTSRITHHVPWLNITSKLL